jgi:hypothetical protein
MVIPIHKSIIIVRGSAARLNLNRWVSIYAFVFQNAEKGENTKEICNADMNRHVQNESLFIVPLWKGRFKIITANKGINTNKENINIP